MNIFESKEQMPPKDNSPDVVRTAQTAAEMMRNHNLTLAPNKDASVQNIEPRRRGHGY